MGVLAPTSQWSSRVHLPVLHTHDTYRLVQDIVTRYASATGHHVTRRFGWDCHGLPVEYEIDKKLDIKSRQDVLAMGIDKYNEECRSIVMRYSKEWEHIVKRIGRWIDFEVRLIAIP